MDKNGNGYIELNELADGFKSIGFNLTYQELHTLMREFDTNGDFRLNLKELFVGLGGA